MIQGAVGRSSAVHRSPSGGMIPGVNGIRGIGLASQPALRSLQQQRPSQRSRCFVAAHAVSGSASNGASSLLKLSIPFAAEWGDSVMVTTSTSGWSVEQAVPLTWSEGDIWHGELSAETGPVEYKYVIRRGAEVSEWQPGENLIVDVPSEPAVLYIEDRWLNEERSVQMQQAAPGLQTQQPSAGEAAQPVPTATDKAAKVTAAAAASSPAAAAQQPTAAEPESEDAAIAAQRGNSLGKPLAKHTVKELKDLAKAAGLAVTGKKQELIDKLIEAGY